MAIGPVQLIVLGFDHPEFHGEIKAELERLRETDTIRVIDALAAYKDANGDVEVEHLSNLTRDEAIELGTTIGALIGLGADGEEGLRGRRRCRRRDRRGGRRPADASNRPRRVGHPRRGSRPTRRPR